MSTRPSLFTRGLSGLSQSSDPNSPSVSSPAEQRDDAKRNFLKTMRPLPTQHYWNVWFDRQAKDQQQPGDEYQVQLEQLGTQIESVQDFWRYNNNTPVDQIKMRESIYLFKSGFKPIWEDRRNVLGGSWTFRVPKTNGPDVWTRVQLLAVGEKLQSVLEDGALPVPPPFYIYPIPLANPSPQKATKSVASASQSASTRTSSPSGTVTPRNSNRSMPCCGVCSRSYPTS
jgi:hypothetical protein